MPFPVIDATDWSWTRDEQMGSKAKLWVLDPDGQRWLFKERRHEHGEDWAEKLAAEIAALIGIPHADVELAVRAGVAGIISKDFLASRAVFHLMHGNELLVQADATYQAKGANFRMSQHTVDKALAVLRQDFITLGVFPDRPTGVTTAPEEFVGYLMLDALIGNTDRHHENWAIVVQQQSPDGHTEAELAPSFDHASCLGRELTDEERERRLSGRPSTPTFDAYWRKMPSRWYRDPGDRKHLHPLAAFNVAAQQYPDAARAWLDRLTRLTDDALGQLTEGVPLSCISALGRQFCRKMLEFGKQQLQGAESR
jgi:hypothetical protein